MNNTVSPVRKYFSSICIISLFIVSVLFFAGCVSIPTEKKTAADLIERPERMFWEIQGTDSQGNPATVYILGTIHLADKRLYPIDNTVLQLWDSADRVAGEISSNGWAQYMTDLQNRMVKSAETARGHDFRKNLTKEELDFLTKTLGVEAVEQFAQFEPWVLNTSLSQVLFTQTGLQASQGYDMYFIAKSQEKNRIMEGLDELSVQLDFLQFGTWDQQIILLKESIATLQKPQESISALQKLYEAYVSNDKKQIRDINIAEMETAIAKNTMYRAYYNALYTDRNKEWAKQIQSWLNEGGTTFIFAGCGHFVGPDTVFDYLRKSKIIQ